MCLPACCHNPPAHKECFQVAAAEMPTLPLLAVTIYLTVSGHWERVILQDYKSKKNCDFTLGCTVFMPLRRGGVQGDNLECHIWGHKFLCCFLSSLLAMSFCLIRIMTHFFLLKTAHLPRRNTVFCRDFNDTVCGVGEEYSMKGKGPSIAVWMWNTTGSYVWILSP